MGGLLALHTRYVKAFLFLLDWYKNLPGANALAYFDLLSDIQQEKFYCFDNSSNLALFKRLLMKF
jgi:hypothetical protein